LSDGEIEAMVRDAEANAEEDKRFEELVQARNAADGLAHAAAKTLEEAGDKASDDEKTAIQSAIKAVEEAVQGDDKDVIDTAAQALSEASSALAQKLYSEQQGQQGQSDQAADATSDGAEDVMDAEFEEVKEDGK
jgi:molecular chaperone DnaK